MTLYELIRRVSKIITPEDDSFFRYVIYTSDDNGGFLRTRYCWWLDRPIEDKDLGDYEYEKVMVTSKNEIDLNDLLDETETKVKIQFTYSREEPTIANAEWDAQLGYRYVYIFDLRSGNYTLTVM